MASPHPLPQPCRQQKPGTMCFANTDSEAPSALQADQRQVLSYIWQQNQCGTMIRPFSTSGGRTGAQPGGRTWRGGTPSSILLREREGSFLSRHGSAPPTQGLELNETGFQMENAPMAGQEGLPPPLRLLPGPWPGQGSSRSPPRGPSSRRQGRGRDSCAGGYLSVAEGLP